MPKTPVTTRHDPGRTRIEAVTETGGVAGFSEYDITDHGDYVFFHTEVDDAYEGQGIGGRLASGVMVFVRGSGKRIEPTCPFLRSWMKKHPETHDLLADGFSL